MGPNSNKRSGLKASLLINAGGIYQKFYSSHTFRNNKTRHNIKTKLCLKKVPTLCSAINSTNVHWRHSVGVPVSRHPNV